MIDHYPQLKALFMQDGKGVPRPSQPPETVSVEKVQEAIGHLQAQDQPVTPAAICRLAGIQRDALELYPQLAWAVQVCHQDKQRRDQQCRQAVEEQVLQAIEHLKSTGDPISQKDICSLTGLSRMVFHYYPDLRAPVALERRRYQQKQQEQRERALVEKVEQAIEDLRSRGILLTQPAVCQQVGYSLNGLQAYPQVNDLLKQVVEERKTQIGRRRQDRDQFLMDEVQAAIEKLQSLGKPVTHKAIGRMVNMSPACLGQYPRVKEILDRVAAETRRARKKKKSALNRHQ